MAATFVIEDGSIVAGANAYCSVAEALQYHENHGNPAEWTGATQSDQEEAIRQATQYLDMTYKWQGLRTSSEQVLDWPRSGVVVYEQFGLDSDAIPQELKDACAYLALKAISATLIPDVATDATIKKQSVKVGPLAKSVEYTGAGDEPGTSYTVADGLVKPLLSAFAGGVTTLVRG
jgi:hypothetical protein